MQLKSKIQLDRFLGIPIIYFLNILFILFKFRKENLGPIKTIYISKYAGMGSIIQATPLINTLRINFPEAKIVFVTHASHLKLISFFKNIDHVYIINDKTIFKLIVSVTSLLLKLIANRGDVYIDLEVYSGFSKIITALSFSKKRLGFNIEGKDALSGIFHFQQSFSATKAISSQYNGFAIHLNCKHLITELDAPRVDDQFFKLSNWGITQKYILINPNASDLRLERRWPAEKFFQLIKEVLKKYPEYLIVLTGSADEQAYVNDLIRSVSDKRIVNTAGKLNLQELIDLIKQAALFITNDTGPMHLAFAIKQKTIALFGPCSPGQYALNENTIAIYKKVSCSPCVHKYLEPPCKGDNICMKQIDIEEVLMNISKFIK